MRRCISTLAAALILLSIQVTSAQSPQSSAPRKNDPGRAEEPAPVLLIDGRPISADEYGLWLIRSQGESLAREYALEYWLIDREAKRLDADVSEAEVALKVEDDFKIRIANAFLGSKDEWLKELARTGRSENGVRLQRMVERRPLLQGKALASINRVVPEDKIERDWQLRYGRKGRKYDVLLMKFKVIVESTPGETREHWRDERDKRMREQADKARGIRERILAGEDFGQLALQYSTEPDTRDHRGVPSGGFNHVGWPEVFLQKLEELRPGEICEPMYARGGFWLVKLLGVKETPLASVAKKIEADLLAAGPESDEIGALQSRLQAGVTVKILPTLYSDQQSDEFPSAYEPAMEVDGEPVRRGEFARWILNTRGEAEVPQFVEEWLVRKKAEELGIQVTQDEVMKRVQDHVQWLLYAGNMTRDRWLKSLELQQQTEQSFLRQLAWRTHVDLLAEKMILRDRVVTPEQVRARFNEVYGEDGVRTEARMIMVLGDSLSLQPEGSKDLTTVPMLDIAESVHPLAREICERLRKGEDFAQLAVQYSKDSDSRERGGMLEGRFRPDTWPPAIGSAVAKLKPHEITDPLQYGQGWLIFEVTSIRKVEFEDVEKELEQEVRTMRPTSTDVAGFRNTLLRGVDYDIKPDLNR